MLRRYHGKVLRVVSDFFWSIGNSSGPLCFITNWMNDGQFSLDVPSNRFILWCPVVKASFLEDVKGREREEKKRRILTCWLVICHQGLVADSLKMVDVTKCLHFSIIAIELTIVWLAFVSLPLKFKQRQSITVRIPHPEVSNWPLLSSDHHVSDRFCYLKINFAFSKIENNRFCYSCERYFYLRHLLKAVFLFIATFF